MKIKQKLKDWDMVQCPDTIHFHDNPVLVEYLNFKYPEVDIVSMEHPHLKAGGGNIIGEAITRNTDFSITYDEYVQMVTSHDQHKLALYFVIKAMDYVIANTREAKLHINSIICLEVDSSGTGIKEIYFAVRGIY